MDALFELSLTFLNFLKLMQNQPQYKMRAAFGRAPKKVSATFGRNHLFEYFIMWCLMVSNKAQHWAVLSPHWFPHV